MSNGKFSAQSASGVRAAAGSEAAFTAGWTAAGSLRVRPAVGFVLKVVAGICVAGLCVQLGAAESQAAETNAPQLLSCKKIWSGAKHNAFTDLIRFRDQWFCTFREADAHVGSDGRIRVLVSETGEAWASAAMLEEAGTDLRDPKLSITADNRLMLVLGGSVYQARKLVERQPRTAFSRDGRTWTAPQRVLERDDWLWRVTWHEGRAYGIVYTAPIPTPSAASSASPPEWTLKFVASAEGTNFHRVTRLEVPNHPNEGTVRFLPNGDCVALVRRDGLDRKADTTAWIGVSRAPYQEWRWHSAGMYVGGPDFLVLPNGTMVAAGRQLNPAPTGARTFVGRMDPDSVRPQLVLPSGGDCSYPGLVWYDNLLWVTYYSSHEGRTSIYLAKVSYR